MGLDLKGGGVGFLFSYVGRYVPTYVPMYLKIIG